MGFIFSRKDTFPDTKQISGKLYILQKPFIADVRMSRKKVVQLPIPEGLITDYGSIPGFAQAFYDTAGKNSAAYIKHDFLYASELVKKKIADWNLLLDLKDDGMNWFKRNAAWIAVKVGGPSVWKKHTVEGINKARELLFITQRNLIRKRNRFHIVYKDGKYAKV